MKELTTAERTKIKNRLEEIEHKISTIGTDWFPKSGIVVGYNVFSREINDLYTEKKHLEATLYYDDMIHEIREKGQQMEEEEKEL